MKKVVAVLIVGVLVAVGVVMASTRGDDDDRAARGPAQTGPQRGGTLTILWKDDVDSIDFGQTWSAGGLQIARATQRSLLSFKPEDATTPIPDLAASLPEIADDGRTVTVRLQPGVRFSPPVNREVTAADVKYAIERGFFKTVHNGYAGIYFADIVGAEIDAEPGTRIPGIETPDEMTVVFRLSRPTARTLAGALVMPLTAPVPREYALPFDREEASTYGDQQVSTGPYMLAPDQFGLRTSAMLLPGS